MNCQNSKKIIQIRERFEHMGDHSGYDQIGEAMNSGGMEIESVWLGNPPEWFTRRGKLLSLYQNRMRFTPFYSKINLWAEIRAFKKSLSAKTLIHVLYGENNLSLLSYIPFTLTNRLITTIHQPVKWWEENHLDVSKFFRRVNALIVLSTAEKKALEPLLASRVHFIPHGIEVDFWTPPDDSLLHERVIRENPKLLFVGQWLRDFESLKNTFRLLTKKFKSVELHLVVPDLPGLSPDNRQLLQEITQWPGVYRHLNATNEELLQLYQDVNLLLLPLLESTANNSILEAISCGLPVITSSTSGMIDYVDDSYGKMSCVADVVTMSEQVCDLLASPSSQIAMSRSARETSCLRFDWRIVARQTLDLYESVW